MTPAEIREAADTGEVLYDADGSIATLVEAARAYADLLDRGQICEHGMVYESRLICEAPQCVAPVEGEELLEHDWVGKVDR